MLNLIGRLTATLVTFAGFATFTLGFHDPAAGVSGWGITVAIAAATAGIVMVVMDILAYVRSRPTELRSPRSIRDFMYRWIKDGGRVAISSRDMSWVSDDEMKELLRAKARQSEIQLFMPQETLFSSELRALGAEVCYYDGPPLRSRFTIIHIERSDTAVAIGQTVEGKHRIVKYGAKDGEPAFWLAQDLSSVLLALARRAAV